MSNIPKTTHSAVVGPDGKTTHVLVPAAEYEALLDRAKADEPSDGTVEEAIRILSDKSTRWYDAEDLVLEVLKRGLREIRRSRGLTQAELGRLLRVPQSRVSRLEKNPEAATLRVLKRVAAALARYPMSGGGARLSKSA